ncbi:MAG: EAL domain-containing protein [Methylomonas sp.]|nr:EAL domain-containing protein [Methylomonas sp.]
MMALFDDRYRTLVCAILLALAMALGGIVGLWLSPPPVYSSALWPPAGIAVAGLMLCGLRTWPGIWLGALFNQFYALSRLDTDMDAVAVLITAVIALGNTGQAVAAVWATRKWLGRGVPALDSLAAALSFLVLAGPLACLISPTVGIAGLWFIDAIPSGQLAANWRNWWLGDSLGVLLLTPMIFCLFAHPRSLWRPRLLSVVLPMSVALMALGLMFTRIHQAEQARIQSEFDGQAAAIGQIIGEYAHNALENTQFLQNVFSDSDHINRAEFKRLTHPILGRHPEIQALAWVPKISRSELAGFEARIRAEGHPDFRVNELGGDRLVPVQNREVYFPIAYIEPEAANRTVLGLDSASAPDNWQSKQNALAHHAPSVSQRIALLQRSDRQWGVLVSIPLFAESSADEAMATDSVRGFISAALLPQRMVQMALDGFNTDGLTVVVHDLTAPENSRELFHLPSANGNEQGEQVLRGWQHDFRFSDRTWQIHIRADSLFVKAHTSPLSWVMLIAGLCFTSLLSVLLLTISGQNAYVQSQVAARTGELEVANAELASTASNLRASENRLRILIESQPECVKLLAQDACLLDINPAGLAIIEADSLAQVLGTDTSQRVVPEYRPRYLDSIQRVFAGESVNLEFEIQTLKGKRRWMDSHAVPLRGSDGQIFALLGLTRDITERKRAEDGLKLAARVFGEAHEGIVITDPSGAIVDVNPMFCEITGYSRDDVLGKNPSILQSGRHDSVFYRDMWRELNEQHHWQGEVWNRKKNGDLYAELLSISALCDENGKPLYFVGLFSDITQSKQQQQMLELLAHYDPLTRLPNRTLFADRLKQAIAHSRRTQSLLAICFLDLDGFKPVNDNFGHDVGDQVLVQVAERIKTHLREDDSVSRHGGDEFTLLIGDIHTLAECEQAVMRIHKAIIEPYFIDGQVITIGASTGITVYPLDNADADTLMRNADHAMYQAKLAGKNRYQVFDASQNQQILDRNQELKAIEIGFMNGEFCLYYQPKLDAASGRIVGAEALIRWLHPERGMIPPLEFLPTVQGTPLEIAIGQWVVEHAWQQLCSWHGQGRLLEISVNIAAHHLLAPDFIEHLTETLAKNPQVESRFLQLEILESSALDDLSAVDRVIGYCRDALGVTTALDDFGTGYSSLAHLRHLSVDTVKIDKGFVRDMLDDADDYAIVESVIGLSHAFRRTVIAEGVENQQHASVLALLGCNVLQGYLIAKPLPVAAFENWLAAFRSYPVLRHYSGNDFTVAQARIEIHRIGLRHWLQQIEQRLTQPTVSVRWPVMVSEKSHFGRWLKLARQQRLYDSQWLDDMTGLHTRLFGQGQHIMQHTLANPGSEMEQAYQALCELQQQIDQQLEGALRTGRSLKTG